MSAKYNPNSPTLFLKDGKVNGGPVGVDKYGVNDNTGLGPNGLDKYQTYSVDLSNFNSQNVGDASVRSGSGSHGPT